MIFHSHPQLPTTPENNPSEIIVVSAHAHTPGFIAGEAKPILKLSTAHNSHNPFSLSVSFTAVETISLSVEMRGKNYKLSSLYGSSSAVSIACYERRQNKCRERYENNTNKSCENFNLRQAGSRRDRCVWKYHFCLCLVCSTHILS